MIIKNKKHLKNFCVSWWFYRSGWLNEWLAHYHDGKQLVIRKCGTLGPTIGPNTPLPILIGYHYLCLTPWPRQKQSGSPFFEPLAEQ